MPQSGFKFSGSTTAQVLQSVWLTIQKKGHKYQSQRGPVKSLKGVLLVINDPLSEKANYPYWSKEEDNWYQDNFVRKETNSPPEKILKGDIYTYKYVWRSRFYDGGLGYVQGFINILKKIGIKKINFKNKAELINFLKSTYKLYHPESILAVISWKGIKLLNFYLANPQILALELKSHRTDTLMTIIEDLKQNPSSRRAIIPSFTYTHIDHSGTAGGVPVYQNYQLYIDFNPKGRAIGLSSFHLHRAMDAMGGTQLDITHDREWGQIASRELGLPLNKIFIYCNDIWYQLPEDKTNKNLSQKTNIRDWLFAVTDSYDPQAEDIEKRLSSPNYQKKIDYTWSKIKPG